MHDQIRADMAALKRECAARYSNESVSVEFANQFRSRIQVLDLHYSLPYGDKWPFPHLIGWKGRGVVPATYGALYEAIVDWEKSNAKPD